MHLHIPLFTATLLYAAQHVSTQGVAANGGGAATLAATQYPTTTSVNSLTTVGGTVTAVMVPYTQTFASTALGSWALGSTPLPGTIGLGTIQGTVGLVTKRAEPTAGPAMARRDSGWGFW